MVALVTLTEVKSRLRIETNDDDAMLVGYVEAASASVINYLKAQADVLLDLDSSGDLPSGSDVPSVIQAATIMLVGYFYRNPDSDPDKDYDMGFLPKPVMALLYPLRDPACA